MDISVGKREYLHVISALKAILKTAEIFHAEEEGNPRLLHIFSSEDIRKIREVIDVLEKPLRIETGDFPEEYRMEFLNRSLRTGLLKMRIRVGGREMNVVSFNTAATEMVAEDDDGNRYKFRDPTVGEIIALDSDDEDGKAAIINMFKAATVGEA